MSSYLSKKAIKFFAPMMTNLGLHHIVKPILGGHGHILMFIASCHKINKNRRIHNHLSIEITPEHFERTIIY